MMIQGLHIKNSGRLGDKSCQFKGFIPSPENYMTAFKGCYRKTSLHLAIVISIQVT